MFRSTLLPILVVLVAAYLPLGAQSVAFTFDDGPKLADTPLLSPQQRNQALLAVLQKHRVRSALFVIWDRCVSTEQGLAMAKAWGSAGHALANHTLSHPDLNDGSVGLQQYQREVLECDERLRGLPGYRPWFRYPYLRQGNTPEKIDGMRDCLRTHGLRNAYVSLDTSDWRLDQALCETLQRDPGADLEPFKLVYLAHLRQRAQAYRGLAQRLFGRDIPQILLLHHNLINALFLEDVIVMFKDMGWTITDPQSAYEDFVYSLEPQRPSPGQSLLISAARSLGYRPDGWERLLDDGDADIAELQRLGVLARDPKTTTGG